MKNKITKINELSSILKDISSNLVNKKSLKYSDILHITDVLEKITDSTLKLRKNSKNVFTESGLVNVSETVENIFEKIQEIENERYLEDEKILRRLHQISFQEDYLELNFSKLTYEDIEMILNQLDYEFEDILKYYPYNAELIQPLVKQNKSKLINLHFRYDFPIMEELNENKDSYAHRIVIRADQIKDKKPKQAAYLLRKIDDLLDLSIISKLFKYGSMTKAKVLFERLDEKLKNRIEKLLWKLKGENKVNNNMSSLLMGYVAEQVNA